jgi:hypothetical protein
VDPYFYTNQGLKSSSDIDDANLADCKKLLDDDDIWTNA